MKFLLIISAIIITQTFLSQDIFAQKMNSPDSSKTKTSRTKEKKELLPESNYKDPAYYSNKALKSCEITSPTEIDGFMCTDEIIFYQSGKIKECILSEPSKKWKFTIPSKSKLYLHEKGYLIHAVFNDEVEIDSVFVIGDGKSKTLFFPSGKLKGAVLSRNQEIQHIPVISNIKFPIIFHDNGKIQECTLSGEYSVNKMTYDKKSTLFFDRKGKIIPKE